MKKIFKISSVLLLALILVGCAAKEDKVIKCTLSSKDAINGYELSSTYEITTDGTIVKSVKSTEIVTSDNESLLSSFETTLKSSYEKMNETYGGYDINITNKDGKVTSITNIDYQKLNLEQLLKDQPSMKNAANSKNQLTLNGVKSIYQSLGATCEE